MPFFINRPIFATVIALLTVLAGTVAIAVLPVGQFPTLAPPQIVVSTQYIGASAEVVANTTTTPLEEQLNGAEGMVYMSSNSTDNGNSNIVMTFDVGFDHRIAEVEALNRANIALAELPSEVRQVGLSITKQSTNLVLAVNLISPNGTYDSQYLGNYLDINVSDALERIPGVSEVQNFGLTKYAIRVWVDPDRLTSLGLTAMDVVDAIQAQNQDVAAGSLGQAPAPDGQPFRLKLSTLGRLEDVEQFGDILLRADPEGDRVRIRDVARVELGSEEYDWETTVNNQATGNVGIFQYVDANSLDIYDNVVAEMDRLATHFPEDVEYQIVYNTTDFIRESVREVAITLAEAIILVALVVFLFLQSFRTTIIPAIAIPVSLVGTFAVLLLFGFSINTLTLLGLVLAVGLVVDDAIVVVENVQRRLSEGAPDARQATLEAMKEVRGPIVATSLSLMAVFVPAAFTPGLSGRLYNQFALTIAISVAISAINSLTLSPALCTVFLRRRRETRLAPFRAFNRGFEALANGYAGSVRVLSRIWYVMAAVFAGLAAAMVMVIVSLPIGFVPEEDQGYFVAIVGLPEASSIERTKEVVREANDILLGIEGISDTVSIAGYDLVDAIRMPNAGSIYVVMEPWSKRKTAALSVEGLIRTAQAALDEIPGARIVAVNAPAIPGISATGGFQIELQALNAQSPDELNEVTQQFLTDARALPEVGTLFTTFNTGVPKRTLEIDREKVIALGVPLNDLFDVLQVNLGSLYVNLMNKFGRVYRVYVQADKEYRVDEEDVARLRVRNRDGDMVELSALVSITPETGPYTVTHYQLYPSALIQGGPAPGYSGAQAVRAVTQLARQLPDGYSFEWTGIVFQQERAGNTAQIVFLISLVVVFLVLAAQYESWMLPLMIILSVPFGVLGAGIALHLRGLELDVYAQIGLIMLIGLTAKNAILIVEFAKDAHDRGAGAVEAAMTAARLRLRPILMTAFAFILGAVPLAIATGAGANGRRSIGTTVVGGMLLATVLIVFIPVFYVVVQRVRDRFGVRDLQSAGAQVESEDAPPSEEKS